MLTIQRRYSWVIQLLATHFTGPPTPRHLVEGGVIPSCPREKPGEKHQGGATVMWPHGCEENLEISNTYTLIAKAGLLDRSQAT